MTKLQHPTQPARTPALVAAAALALLSLALCAQWGARAQSGRHGAKPAATPTPSPEATPQGESESVPRGRAPKPADVVASFVVMDYEDAFVGVDFRAREDVMDSFMQRLRQARAVAASYQGHGNRKEARDRAKAERDAYVVLFELNEDTMGGGPSMGRADTRTLVVKTYVYAPKTGDLKFTDTIYQRPYRETARIGGIPVPVPTRRIEQYPSQLQLEQAARDAADRIMQRFGVTLPPDN
jgi:hypothetical protein